MTADKPASPVAHPRGPRQNSATSASSVKRPSQDTIIPCPESPAPLRSMSLGSSPTKEQRDTPGSSRTKYTTQSLTLSPKSHSPPASVTVTHPEADFEPLIDISETPTPAPPAKDVSEEDGLNSLHAPYREPEMIIEPMNDLPPDYAIAEDPISEDGMLGLQMSNPHQDDKSAFDISSWQNAQQPYEPMDTEDTFGAPERPRLGPGDLPIRVLEQIHDHRLHQPQFTSLPQAHPRKSHTPSPSISQTPKSPTTSIASTINTPLPDAGESASVVPEVPVATMADVWNACPGGAERHNEWFFCPRCWGWLRVVVTKDSDLIQSMEEWELTTEQTEDLPTRRGLRLKDWARYNDLKTYRSLSTSQDHHFHLFRNLVDPTTSHSIARIDADSTTNAFPHLLFGVDSNPAWSQYASRDIGPRVFIDSNSDLCVFIDQGLLPGQLSQALVDDYTYQKMTNPRPGVTGTESIKEAWTLLSTLLANALFKKQRGWVQMENSKFKSIIGASIASSNLLYQIGFGCKQEEDVFRVGPFDQGGSITKEQADQMNQYMLRAWVEINMYLDSFKSRNDLVDSESCSTTMDKIFAHDLDLSKYPMLEKPNGHWLSDYCNVLGASRYDTLETIMRGYDLQIATDPARSRKYLDALEKISGGPYVGKEAIQMKIATERSLGRYTSGDLAAAYKLIGYDENHAALIGVSAEEAPEDYILELHKKATQAASAAWERSDLSAALALIGKDRGSALAMRLAKAGQTFLSVDEAYASLSAPQDCIDDGLIMQYEMAVADYPGKTEHYKMCMDIIANAPGRERPSIKRFLETGSREPPPPTRKDIPVGLQNIGNTCYLNSILQYLYSIRPLREAVLAFDQNASGSGTPVKPEIERSRRCKPEQRVKLIVVVRQLRLLFLQLYKSEQSSVRPEEELAYLAITRPEVDQIVEPDLDKAPAGSILDAIPTVPSPSSTRVNTPELSPTIPSTSLPGSPRHDVKRSSSILGKRPGTDRDDSSRSSLEHSRLKSEGFEDLGDVKPIEEQDPLDEAMDDDSISREPESPTAVTDLEGLKLKSPELEDPKEHTVPPPLPARPPLIKKDTLASGLRFGLQQDSAEVLINVLTQLELAFDPASADDEDGSRGNIISELFSCKYRQQTFYASASGAVEAQTPVESVFVHPIIGVEEVGKDLYDCLGELYLRGDEIEYEGKKGYMMDLMDSFPPMLYIQMRRSQYDPRTGRETKTNTHIAFDQVLCMDRFLAGADPKTREQSVEITREMTRVRSRLHQLRNNKPKSIPDTFVHAREALAALKVDDTLGLDITDDFLSALDREADAVKKEISDLEEKLPELKQQLDKVWENEREYEYDLVSVFMHRGKTSGAGHYWTYQSHLPDHPEEFFKYNDELVTAVPASEVLEDRTGSDANPALLCYVRRGKNLVDTLHREILELNLLGDEETIAEPMIEVEGKS